MQKLRDYFDTNWLVLAITFNAIVIVLTHIPQELAPSQLQAGGVDKFLHVVAYGAITFFLVLSIKTPLSLPTALLILFVLLAIGFVDEITQSLVGRQTSFTDIGANTVGILMVLSLSVACKRQLQSLKTEPVSRLCFTAAVAFVVGVLVLPLTLVSLSVIQGPSLKKRQAEVHSFFYKTTLMLFEGNYNPDEGTVSSEALEIFSEHGLRLGGKCWLHIYDDWYHRSRQKDGYFAGMVFFPSGDIYSVRIERADEHFVLSHLSRVDWDYIWKEEALESMENYDESH